MVFKLFLTQILVLWVMLPCTQVVAKVSEEFATSFLSRK
jgi:hypothetical protein